jgi:hypothetical protein
MINEQHRAPMTLARLKAVAASPNGFETVTPQGARQLLEEIAGQPEAPKGQEAATAGCADKQFGEPEPICEAHRQAISAVDALRSRLAAAKAKIAEVTLAKDTFFDALQKANARADAAERTIESNNAKWAKLAEETMAQVRVTAAERAVLGATEGLAPAWADSAVSSTDARIRKLGRALLANRAARLKLEQSEHSATLELWAVNRRELEAKQCTPEERAVLGAWGLLSDSALEHLRVNGSIPLSNIAVTELANRAAKAKAGA